MLNFKAQGFQWNAGRLLPVEMDHLIFKKSTIQIPPHYFQNTHIYVYMYIYTYTYKFS